MKKLSESRRTVFPVFHFSVHAVYPDEEWYTEAGVRCRLHEFTYIFHRGVLRQGSGRGQTAWTGVSQIPVFNTECFGFQNVFVWLWDCAYALRKRWRKGCHLCVHIVYRGCRVYATYTACTRASKIPSSRAYVIQCAPLANGCWIMFCFIHFSPAKSTTADFWENPDDFFP